jgi:hypothetical protein
VLVNRMKHRALAAAVLAVAGLAATLLWVGRGDGNRDAARSSASATIMKEGGRVTRAGATLQPAGPEQAQAERTQSGVDAFRAFSDDFVEANPDAVKEHMQREGLTRAETKELTYFALLASESHDWDAVESLTNHPMEEEARRQAWSQMQRRSRQMADELRALVKSEASEAERWAAINKIEADYLADYYLLTGMNPALLDELLRRSVEGQSAAETAAALAPGASSRPPGAGANCVRRDPDNPQAAPVPVPCPM